MLQNAIPYKKYISRPYCEHAFSVSAQNWFVKRQEIFTDLVTKLWLKHYNKNKFLTLYFEILRSKK